jgi:hypothetical protein
MDIRSNLPIFMTVLTNLQAQPDLQSSGNNEIVPEGGPEIEEPALKRCLPDIVNSRSRSWPP